MVRAIPAGGQRALRRRLAALCAGAWLATQPAAAATTAPTAGNEPAGGHAAGELANGEPTPGEQALALCAQAEAAPDDAALATLETGLGSRLGVDHAAYEAAIGRNDAAAGAYFGLLRQLADAIQARMAEAWAETRAAEAALAAAPRGEDGAPARAAAEAALERARATLDALSQQFAATPAEQAVALGPEMMAEYDSAVVEQAAAREALAAIEAHRAPRIAAQRAVTQCIARRRQTLAAEEQARIAAQEARIAAEEARIEEEQARIAEEQARAAEEARAAAQREWSGDGAYQVSCRNAAFNHAGRVRLTRHPDGRLAVAVFVPPERGGGVVSLEGAMDGMGRINVAQNLGGVLWLVGGTVLPHPQQPGRLVGSGTGRFANPMQSLDCAMQWRLDP